jgi:IPT/TIG domain-containing protein
VTAPRSKRRGFVVRLAVVGSTALTGLIVAGSAFALNVTGFSPNSGLPNKDAGQACPGNVIIISGSGFVSDGSPVTVSFNGTPVEPGGLQIGSDSTMYAIVPGTATTGPITVSDAKGSMTAPGGTFYVNPCPQVSLSVALANPSAAAGQMTPGLLGKKAVSPSSGKVGTKVTLTGYDLLGVTGVAFGSVKAKFQIVSPTQITTTVPAGAKTGKIQLSYTIAPTVSQGGVTPDPTKNGNPGNPSGTQLSPKAFTVTK